MIKENKEKVYFEKELEKVVYEELEDNQISFDCLVEDINYLLDVEWVDFIWYNKNSRNYGNILESKLYNETSVQLWEKRAKEVYKNVLDCIEDKEELEVIKKYEDDFISFLKDFEVGVSIGWDDWNYINIEEYEINRYISSVEKKEDFNFERNPTTYYNYIFAKARNFGLFLFSKNNQVTLNKTPSYYTSSITNREKTWRLTIKTSNTTLR